MKRLFTLLTIAAVARFPAMAQNPGNPFAGRWDMTVSIGNGHFPSWLEVTEKGASRRGCSNPPATSPLSPP